MNRPVYSVSSPSARLTWLVAMACLTSFSVLGFQGKDTPPGELPATRRLTFEGNLSAHFLEQAHAFAERKIAEAVKDRPKWWKRDFSSAANYDRSVSENRERLKKYLGLEDRSAPAPEYNQVFAGRIQKVYMEKYAVNGDSVLVAETSKYRVYQVRWPVLERVYGEGLLVQPKTAPAASVIAVPDAGQTPEQLMGLAAGIPAESQFARTLAENGFEVLIPVLIDRSPVFEGQPHRQTRREWIYRQAFHMGRHIIGYEIEKVLAAAGWIRQFHGAGRKVGVAGYLEGGLIAFYAAAVDPGIDAVMVSGYFSDREHAWDEPIYRNVWGLTGEFGDAEIAGLVAPRPLVVEYSAIPEIRDGPKPDSSNLYKYSGYKGHLSTPGYAGVKSEFDRIGRMLKPGFQKRELVTGPGNEAARFGSAKALEVFAGYLNSHRFQPASQAIPADLRKSFDPEERQVRQLQELNDHVQWLLRVSDYERNRFFLHKIMPEWADRQWSTKSYHPYSDPAPFIKKTAPYRRYFAEEIIGTFPDPLKAPDPRSRKIYDEKLWTGYEVVLDVYEGFSTGGVLLLPKDISKNEKRPVVVIQHGRNGVPAAAIEGNTSYYDMGAKLADQGFIVFVPYGLYNGEDRYRWLSRKANGIKKTLFSFVLAQHTQMLSWLKSLPQADKDRIAFYGKSYGGEMAMRIPSILEGYCLSICSGDFGDWSRKVVDTNFPRSFMYTIEWEMPYFNMGSTFSYAEMAYLIFPRPFMAERGRHDTVQPDEWVGYEYAKVSHLYDQFGMKDKTDIEFFNGGHASRNEGVFQFLHKHLNWP